MIKGDTSLYRNREVEGARALVYIGSNPSYTLAYDRWLLINHLNPDVCSGSAFFPVYNRKLFTHFKGASNGPIEEQSFSSSSSSTPATIRIYQKTIHYG